MDSMCHPKRRLFCKKRGLTNICRASINDIPFASDTLAAGASVDVFECDSVIEDQAYSEDVGVMNREVIWFWWSRLTNGS